MLKRKIGNLTGLLIALSMVCANNLSLYAQESFSGAYNSGPILVHSASIKEIIIKPVKGFTINYAFPNSFGKKWRHLYNYPNYGLSYNYKSYGNPNILGSSHSITAFLQISFLKQHNIFDIGFKGFAGTGYFNKKYDVILNPKNRAISAHLNYSAEARIYTKIRVQPVFIEYSFGLNHFSNGLTKAPNLGINVLNNTVALGIEMEDRAPYKKVPVRLSEKNNKNEFWAFGSFGLKEIEDQNQKYTFSSVSLNYSRELTLINKIGLGFDFLNDPSLTSYAYTSFHYLGSPDLNYRYGVNIHHEFMMGPTGLFAAYGFYLRDSEYYVSRGYYKAGFKFYKNNFIAVVLIRAIPLFRADVVEFGLGYRLKGKQKS